MTDEEIIAWGGYDGDSDPIMDELRAAAFEVLLLNPGSDQNDWAMTLIGQYGCNVVDAYGDNPPEVFHCLADLWDAPYYDPNSGLEYCFKEWALAFFTEEGVRMYYDLTGALDRMKK